MWWYPGAFSERARIFQVIRIDWLSTLRIIGKPNGKERNGD
jgi:hypothetical protein